MCLLTDTYLAAQLAAQFSGYNQKLLFLLYFHALVDVEHFKSSF